jgi:quinol---cytochrome c reductase iron-sulfur subunit, bacillus type
MGDHDSDKPSTGEQRGQERRSFCVACIYGLSSLIGAALAVPAIAYLLLPPKNRTETGWIDAGDVGELGGQKPQEVTFRRIRTDGWKVSSEKGSAWVVKVAANQVVAFSPACTHLGCAYHWNDQKGEFECPCHGSAFGKDGKVLRGPAPRPLDRYEVKLEGNELWLGPVRQSRRS